MNPVEWNPWPEGQGKDGIWFPGLLGPSLVESLDVLVAMRDAIPQHGSFLELGTWCGTTAAWLAQERPDASIVAIDAFFGPPGSAETRAQLALLNLQKRPNVSLWCGTIANFFRLSESHRFDACLVDADHSEAGCLNDLHAAALMVTLPGVIFVHDYGNPYHAGVSAAVDRFVQDGIWNFQGIVQSLAILRRGGCDTSGHSGPE